MLERLGAFVRGFLLAAENHEHAALGAELDDHVRALVGDPDVVLFIDADRVREGPCVQVVSNLANKAAVGTKLEKLRGGSGIGGARRIAARENEYVPLGIRRNSGDFTEIKIGRQLQKIRNGAVFQFDGRVLGKERTRHDKQEQKAPAFHSTTSRQDFDSEIPRGKHAD